MPWAWSDFCRHGPFRWQALKRGTALADLTCFVLNAMMGVDVSASAETVIILRITNRIPSPSGSNNARSRDTGFTAEHHCVRNVS